jgi:hypothetical protein
MTHTLMLSGPFTDHDITRIIQLVHDIESTQPTERFDVVMDDPETGERMKRILEEVNVRPGYERITITKSRG